MSDINSVQQLELGAANLASPFLPVLGSMLQAAVSQAAVSQAVLQTNAPTPGLAASAWSNQGVDPTVSESVNSTNPVARVQPQELNLASSSAPTTMEGPTTGAPSPGGAVLTGWGHPGMPTFGDWDLRALGQSLTQAANLLFAPPSANVPGPVQPAPFAALVPNTQVPSTPAASDIGTAHIPSGTPASGVSPLEGVNPFTAALRLDALESPEPVHVDGVPLTLIDHRDTAPAQAPAGRPATVAATDTVSPVTPGSAATHHTDGSSQLPDATSAVTQPPAPPTRLSSAETQPLEPTSGTAWPAPAAPDVPALDGRAQHSWFDPHAVRRQFPILQQRVNGKQLVWLDNAATTQKPQVVIDRLKTFYENENSNIHRAAHTLAARATDAYEGARKSVQRFINAPSVDTVVFTRGATEAINLVAQTFGTKFIGEGDEIVISWLEHHANIVPWQQLALQRRARLRVAPVDDNGDIVLSEFQRLLNGRTRLVAFTQVSNALGTITPAHEMIEIAHRAGARVLLDGAQSISHMPVDVQALDCDFYVFSGHKVFAPTGIGALYGKSEVLESLPPWQGGGNMIQDVTFERVLFQRPPARFEAGTGNIADAVGLGAALDWLSSVGIHNVERYEHELLEYGLSQLATVPGLRMVANPSRRAGVLSFVLDGHATEQVGGLLDKEGIAVRSGHHCAQPILRRFGVEASVRASLAPYNTFEDIDALVAALRRLQLNQPQQGARRA